MYILIKGPRVLLYCRFNTDSMSVFVRMIVHCCLVKNIHPKQSDKIMSSNHCHKDGTTLSTVLVSYDDNPKLLSLVVLKLHRIL